METNVLSVFICVYLRLKIAFSGLFQHPANRLGKRGQIKVFDPVSFIFQARQPVAGNVPARNSRDGLVPASPRAFFRDQGEYLLISRVLDRKQAYR